MLRRIVSRLWRSLSFPITRALPDAKRWYLPDRLVLSARRLCGYWYFVCKRKLGRDYSFTPPGPSEVPIDVFITVVEKDAPVLELAVAAVRKEIMHPVGAIYLVAPAGAQSIKRIADEFGCRFVDEETIIPLRKGNIDYVGRGGGQKGGWIYKMLLNLSADLVCGNRHMLVLDADTIFIGPQLFLYKNRPLFNLSDEYHEPYFSVNSRLLGLPHPLSRSFITHYMLFDAEVLQALRAAIEERWNRPWFEAILECIDTTESSAFADYELYGDYYLSRRFPRPIFNYWNNVSLRVRRLPKRIDDLIEQHAPRYRSISLHT